MNQLFPFGTVKGMFLVLKRLLSSYPSDIQENMKAGSLFRATSPQVASERASVNQKGLITVEYPEVKLKPPENFRFIPFLIYEPVTDSAGKPIVDAATGKEEI